jgi:hypothetical protein
MNQTDLPVIARIPDLDSSGSQRRRRKSQSSSSQTTNAPVVFGRFLNAGLSMKLLVGLGLFLMLGAVGPYIFIRYQPSAESNVDQASEQTWQSSESVPTADLTPVWEPPGPPSLPEIQPAITQRQPEKSETEPAGLAQSSPWPRKIEEQADFSPWPNPAHPIVAQAAPWQGEPHTADRRGGPPSNLDGAINIPSDRNTYDRSRSSIH